MLKEQTIKDLKKVFEKETEESILLPGLHSEVEIVNLDLIRIHINTRGSPVYRNIIFDILRKNNEAEPLTIHEEAARSCNLLYYIDIINR